MYSKYLSDTNAKIYVAGHRGLLGSAIVRRLKKHGFNNITFTPASNDQGVDIIAEYSGGKIAVQCKRYNKTLGNSPIQEVFAGSKVYDCNAYAVMTNNYFSKGAKDLAKKTGVVLWDRDTIIEMLSSDYSK